MSDEPPESIQEAFWAVEGLMRAAWLGEPVDEFKAWGDRDDWWNVAWTLTLMLRKYTEGDEATMSLIASVVGDESDDEDD